MYNTGAGVNTGSKEINSGEGGVEIELEGGGNELEGGGITDFGRCFSHKALHTFFVAVKLYFFRKCNGHWPLARQLSNL